MRKPVASRCCSPPSYATKHRDTVLVIDAAHEIGMNIVIARPETPQGPAPSMLAAPAAATPKS